MATHQAHFKELFGSTTHGVGVPKAAAITVSAIPTANHLKQQLKKNKQVPATHKASLATVICSYILITAVVLWLIFSISNRVAPSISSTKHYERTCVDMTRHKVKPFTPAIDSNPGGSMEPFAFGSLIFDIENEEVTWNFSDSLGVEPHELAIRGPLKDENSTTAPIFIMLGLQRDKTFRLSGSANTNREKLYELKNNPKLYYVSVRESLVDGKVRELVRDSLEKKCIKGIE